jgi:hypothetical protein
MQRTRDSFCKLDSQRTAVEAPPFVRAAWGDEAHNISHLFSVLPSSHEVTRNDVLRQTSLAFRKIYAVAMCVGSASVAIQLAILFCPAGGNSISMLVASKAGSLMLLTLWVSASNEFNVWGHFLAASLALLSLVHATGSLLCTILSSLYAGGKSGTSWGEAFCFSPMYRVRNEASSLHCVYAVVASMTEWAIAALIVMCARQV